MPFNYIHAFDFIMSRTDSYKLQDVKNLTFIIKDTGN